jgi:phosphatidylserine/phosphatidylglycerophosphate/cardiolipin synthase-like enzyme
MKARVIPFLSIILLIGLSYMFFNLESPVKITSSIQDEGTIEIFFCPEQDCEGALVSFLDSAEESIHCALFEVGLESVQQKLLEKSETIEVQVVTDDGYLDRFNHPFVKSDSWGLMHNKFCLIDGTKLSTGSMNPTNNGAHKNNNNLLLINSPVLSQNYEDEFQELWMGTFKKGDKVRNPNVILGDIKIQSYFCPDDLCAEKIKDELNKAEESIKIMAFSFTHDGIANVLLLKNLEGVDIRGVFEARQVTKYSKFDVLQYQVGDDKIMKDGNKQNMHHKTFIIDGKTVITGSMNPTAGGNERNDENVLIIEDEGIASLYLEEFERVWGEATSK